MSIRRPLLGFAALALSACAGMNEAKLKPAPELEPVAETALEPMDLALACPPADPFSEDGIGGTGCPAAPN